MVLSDYVDDATIGIMLFVNTVWYHITGCLIAWYLIICTGPTSQDAKPRV
jgi:hypothetical protein